MEPVICPYCGKTKSLVLYYRGEFVACDEACLELSKRVGMGWFWSKKEPIKPAIEISEPIKKQLPSSSPISEIPWLKEREAETKFSTIGPIETVGVGYLGGLTGTMTNLSKTSEAIELLVRHLEYVAPSMLTKCEVSLELGGGVIIRICEMTEISLHGQVIPPSQAKKESQELMEIIRERILPMFPKTNTKVEICTGMTAAMLQRNAFTNTRGMDKFIGAAETQAGAYYANRTFFRCGALQLAEYHLPSIIVDESNGDQELWVHRTMLDDIPERFIVLRTATRKASSLSYRSLPWALKQAYAALGMTIFFSGLGLPESTDAGSVEMLHYKLLHMCRGARPLIYADEAETEAKFGEKAWIDWSKVYRKSLKDNIANVAITTAAELLKMATRTLEDAIVVEADTSRYATVYAVTSPITKLVSLTDALVERISALTGIKEANMVIRKEMIAAMICATQKVPVHIPDADSLVLPAESGNVIPIGRVEAEPRYIPVPENTTWAADLLGNIRKESTINVPPPPPVPRPEKKQPTPAPPPVVSIPLPPPTLPPPPEESPLMESIRKGMKLKHVEAVERPKSGGASTADIIANSEQIKRLRKANLSDEEIEEEERKKAEEEATKGERVAEAEWVRATFFKQGKETYDLPEGWAWHKVLQKDGRTVLEFYTEAHKTLVYPTSSTCPWPNKTY
jgi:hypothetical protein